MATYVNFYTIAFENSKKETTTRSIIGFLKKIENLAETNVDEIARKINGNQYRISSYFWPDVGEQFVVIPIGKVKNGSPYVESVDRKDFKELDQKVYDVNILAYDVHYKTMLLTNHQSAPSVKEIEDYFNSFLLPDEPIKIRINPIKHNTGIESVRNARGVRSVIFNLDLGAGTIDMFQSQINKNESLASYLQQFVKGAKENIMGKTMKLEIGLGHDKKVTSLDKETLLDLITTLNIDSRAIKEIEVRYYGGEKEKIDKARLKSAEMFLKHQFSLSGSKIGAEYLKHHLEDAYGDKYGKFATHIREYFLNTKEVDGQYTFVEQWRGDVIVN